MLTFTCNTILTIRRCHYHMWPPSSTSITYGLTVHHRHHNAANPIRQSSINHTTTSTTTGVQSSASAEHFHTSKLINNSWSLDRRAPVERWSGHYRRLEEGRRWKGGRRCMKLVSRKLQHRQIVILFCLGAFLLVFLVSDNSVRRKLPCSSSTCVMSNTPSVFQRDLCSRECSKLSPWSVNIAFFVSRSETRQRIVKIIRCHLHTKKHQRRKEQ